MSDRPAPPTSPPATLDKQGSPPAEPPRGPKPGEPYQAPGDGDTAVRPGLAERIQAKLAGSGRGGSAEDADVMPGTSGSVVPSGAPSRGGKQRGPRKARLRLTRIDPWSVMKTSFLLAIAFGIVTVAAVAVIMQVLEGAGVWDSINSTIQGVLDDPNTAAFDVRNYVGTERVLGFTMLVAAVDVVLITAIATLGAFLYNMAAALLGGIEVTLAEDN